MKRFILGGLSVLLMSATAAPVFASSTSPAVGNTTVDVLLKQQQPVRAENNSVNFIPVRKGIVNNSSSVGQTTKDVSPDSIHYNGNGELSPNDNTQSPDSNNPGLNQSPENRLTPANINRV